MVVEHSRRIIKQLLCSISDQPNALIDIIINVIRDLSLKWGGGGGRGGRGGGSPDIFVKLDFEIAVEQQTRAHDRTFEGVSDSGCTPVSAGQTRPYFVNFCPYFAKSP